MPPIKDLEYCYPPHLLLLPSLLTEHFAQENVFLIPHSETDSRQLQNWEQCSFSLFFTFPWWQYSLHNHLCRDVPQSTRRCQKCVFFWSFINVSLRWLITQLEDSYTIVHLCFWSDRGTNPEYKSFKLNCVWLWILLANAIISSLL